MKDSRETRKDHGGGRDHVINMCGEKLWIIMQPSKPTHIRNIQYLYGDTIWRCLTWHPYKNVGGFPHKMLIIYSININIIMV